jgi:hypothetical protein
VSVVVAEEAGQVTVFGVNDTPEDWQGELRCGVFTLAGAYLQDESRTVTLAANASTPLATIDHAAWADAGYERAGAFARLSDSTGRQVAQHRLFLARFKDLALTKGTITVRREGDRAVFSADRYVWGVCLDIEGDAALADNAFDLLPGIPYEVPWPASAPDPKIASAGADLVMAGKTTHHV